MDEELLWTTNMEGAGSPSQLDEEEQLTKENMAYVPLVWKKTILSTQALQQAPVIEWIDNVIKVPCIIMHG